MRLHRYSVGSYAVHGGCVVAAQNLRFFRNEGVVGRRHAFRHCNEGQIVVYFLVGEVDNVEIHCVFADSVGVVVQFDFASVLAVDGYVRFGVYGICQTCKSRTLLTGRIGIAFLVLHYRCRRHKQLVCQNGNFLHAHFGEGVFQILTDKHHDSAKVGRSHTCSAQFVVAASRHGGKNVASVCGDVRFEFQRGRRSPTGKV